MEENLFTASKKAVLPPAASEPVSAELAPLPDRSNPEPSFSDTTIGYEAGVLRRGHYTKGAPYNSLPLWDIRPVAEQLFQVRDNGSELKWAETAWGHIVAAGLAASDFGEECCRARLRFLALATLFSDWYSLIGDQEPEGQIDHFIQELDISLFYLGLMLEPNTVLDDTDYYGCFDEQCAIKSALHISVRRERPVVAQALLQGFGGTAGLFVSPWNTHYPSPDTENEWLDAAQDPDAGMPPEHKSQAYREQQESAEEILNRATSEKQQAWQWIAEGCPTLH